MTVLIGVTASVAMYRTCDIVRGLTKKGHDVRVAMTRTAEQWISPVLFSALSGNDVYSDNINEKSGMPHIDIRKDLDVYLVAPATADVIARAATGRADDIVTATLLSFNGPRVFAPSMNPYMYSHPATQKNMAELKKFGYLFIDPANGDAVCGDSGDGKMAPVEEIIDFIDSRAFE